MNDVVNTTNVYCVGMSDQKTALLVLCVQKTQYVSYSMYSKDENINVLVEEKKKKKSLALEYS